MAVDITKVQRQVLGVNYLGANGAECVRQIWNERFAADEAFLLDATDQENARGIVERFRDILIEMQKKKQQKIELKDCILVFFVDYTSELQDSTAAAVWNLKFACENVLKCNVQAVLQFVYVGEKGLDETAIQRSNIQKALEHNSKKEVYENYRLFLVGKSALHGWDNIHWKSTIIFVDLMRRCAGFADYLPRVDRDSICFLRYGEFDESRYDDLVRSQRQLNALLANADSSKLRTLVERKRHELVDTIEAIYQIDGALHPQHPDMEVEDPTGFVMPWATNTRKAAKNDKNPAYSNAQRNTRAAVEATGDRMRREITEWFDSHIAHAQQTLEEFFEQGDVGIKLKLNPVEMKSALYMVPYPEVTTPPKLALKYSEAGVAGEIEAYLNYIKTNTISNGLKRYSAALQAAFEAIPQESFASQKRELERELDGIGLSLNEALDAKAFCKKMTLESPPDTVFDTVNGMNVKAAKFLLARNRFLPTAEKAAALGSIMVHHVDEHLCGIVRFDNAPVKALMIDCIECQDWVLDQLLPEVNYGF